MPNFCEGPVENLPMFTRGYPRFRRIQVENALEMLTSHVNMLRFSTGLFFWRLVCRNEIVNEIVNEIKLHYLSFNRLSHTMNRE